MRNETAIREALEDPNTLATVLHCIMRRQYGEACYDWDSMTCLMELRDDFKAEVHPTCMDRWSAVQVLMTSDAFFTRLDAFLNVCNTFAGGQPLFDVFDPVTTEEAAWGITEALMNREPAPWAYSIKQYIAQILRDDGYDSSNLPAPFEFLKEDDAVVRIRRDLVEGRNNDNRDGVEQYLDEQTRDLVFQLDAIPDLRNIDDQVLRGLMSVDQAIDVTPRIYAP